MQLKNPSILGSVSAQLTFLDMAMREEHDEGSLKLMRPSYATCYTSAVIAISY